MREKVNRDENWVWENGRKFTDIVNKYGVSEIELLAVCETIGREVKQEGIRNVDIFMVSKDTLEEPVMINHRAEGAEADLDDE